MAGEVWEHTFREYALEPMHFWPSGQPRQADKLTRKLSVRSTDHGEAVEHVVESARQRLGGRPTTIFLINCGSSGSHWLTTMLAELSDVVDCGEVYLPATLQKTIKDWSSPERSAFIDCVHVAHGLSDPEVSPRSVVLNSAHSWSMANLFADEKRLILLLRDPLDVVLSRTFRKDEYRTAIAPSASDREYLATNVDYVRRFFEQAWKTDYDLVVRYEELIADSKEVLAATCTSTTIQASEQEIEAAARRHGLHSETTNSYRGRQKTLHEELVSFASSELEGVRRAWGYDS